MKDGASQAVEAAVAAMQLTLKRLAAGPRDGQSPAARLEAPAPAIVPSRVRQAGNALADLFAERARRVSATLEEVAAFGEVPVHVARYLDAQGLPATIYVSPDPLSSEVAWSKVPHLVVAAGPLPAEGAVAVAGTFAAVAETGSLVIVSGERSPVSYHMVPETEIALVKKSTILGTQEDVWARLRKSGEDVMPRDLTFVSGPSRTADIEMRVELGAHGPRRLHILVLADR